MTYNYEFATGTQTVEIDEKWASILTELDKQEKRNNHTETRRHESYTNGIDDSEWLAVEDEDIENLFNGETDEEKLHKAISKLKPAQKALIIAIYFNGVTQVELAHMQGVSQQAISKNLRIAKKNLKKFF